MRGGGRTGVPVTGSAVMRSRLSAALAAVLVAVLLGAPTASADTSRAFDLWVGTQVTPGKARANGTATFRSAERNRVTIRGLVDDRCPKDGYGATLQIMVFFRDGSRTGTGAFDDAGCRAAGERFAWTSPASPARVARVELTFYEHDQETMQIGDLVRRTLRP